MSKPVADHHESVEVPDQASSSQVGSSTSEHQFGSLAGSEGLMSDVHNLTRRHNLECHSHVLHKAATLQSGTLSESSSIPGITVAETEALQDETENKWRQPKLLYYTILVCSIGAIEQGWAQTGMNGANLSFPEALGIGSNSEHDNFLVGLINSGIFLGVCLL